MSRQPELVVAIDDGYARYAAVAAALSTQGYGAVDLIPTAAQARAETGAGAAS